MCQIYLYINVVGVYLQVLGGYKNPNNKLISLNLTGNNIGDEGGKAIAEVSSSFVILCKKILLGDGGM